MTPTVFPATAPPLRARERTLLLLAGAVAAVAVAAAVYVAWARPGFDHATGSWFALAYDLARGELYRPLVGESGFGGTRWLPLFPAGLALLEARGMTYIAAAWWINVVSLAAILLAVRTIVRREGAAPAVAWVFGVLAVCSLGALTVMRSFRGDLLPVALAVWGVVLSLKASAPRQRPWLAAAAAMLFVLAITAKTTAVFWPLAVFVSYLLRRRIRLAWVFAGVGGVALALALLGIQWASSGRFTEVMAATSAAGGGLFRALLGPWYLERFVRGSDPLGMLAVGASVTALVVGRRTALTSIPGCLFLSMILMSALIFGSPGTIENHLVDLSVAAMTLWGIAWTRIPIPRTLAAAALTVYAATMAVPSYSYYWSPEPYFRNLAVEHLKTLPGTVLSEHPAVALAAGKHPHAEDTFMLRVLRGTHPEVDRAFREAIEDRVHDTIILSNLDKEKGWPAWYDEVHFGPGFLEMLRANYKVEKRIGHYTFFRPRPAAAGDGRPEPGAP